MADRRLSLEDIANYQILPQTSATPTPTPLMTPLVSAAEPSQSSPFGGSIPSPARLRAERLGIMDATTTGATQGLEDVYQTYAGIPTLVENAPSLLKSAYEYTLEQPGSALLTGLRGLAKTGAMGVGAFGGGVLGTAGGATAGSVIPGAGTAIGGLTGGLVGAGTGAEAGAIAYEKLENTAVKTANEVRSLLGLPAYELPYPEQYGTEVYQRLVRGAVGGGLTDLLNRATFGAARVGTGVLPKKAINAFREYKDEMIPLPKGSELTLDQKSAVGDIFQQTGVTKEQLEQAAALKNSGLPEYANLSTADLVGNEKLKVAEAAVAQSPAGQLPFYEMDKKQLEELNQMVGDLTSFPGSEGFELGQKIRESFVKLKQESTSKISSLYDFLYEQSGKTQYTTTDLAKEISKTADKVIPEGYARDKSVIDKIIKNLTPKDDVGMPTFKETSTIEGGKKIAGTENLYDIRNLVGVSSRLKTEARALRDKKLGREATMYDQAADVVDAFIKKTEFSKEFEMANAERAKFAQLFEQGNVSNLDVPFAIPAEGVAASLGQNTDQWVQSLKVLGKDQDATRALLTQKLRDFASIGDVNAKIKWLDDNASLFKSTSGVQDIADARDKLIRVRNALAKREKGQAILGDVNLDGIGIGDIQKAALIGETSALGDQDKAMVQGIRQVVRDKQRQATAGSVRSLAGLSSPTRSIGAAGVGLFLGKFLGKKVTKGIEQLNSAMAKALADPEYALEMFKERGRLATKRNIRTLRDAEAAVALRDAKIAIGAGDQATRERVSGISGAGAAMLGALSNITPTPAAESETSPFNRMATATPAPAPTPAAGKVTSKMSLADIAKYKTIATPAPSATATPSELKAKAPQAISQKIDATATKYDLDPALMHAIVDQESKFNPKAISKMKAGGLMQLMPAVAAKLGVDDVYNEDQNLEGGAKLLRQLIKRFDNDIELVLAAYNSTPSRISRQMEILRSNKIAPTWSNMVKYSKGKKPLVHIPAQTLAYVPKVLGKRELYRS